MEETIFNVECQPSTSSGNKRKGQSKAGLSTKRMKTDETTQNLNQTKQNIIELHGNITKENYEKVKENIQKITFDQHAYNDAGHSAVATSLKVFNLEIYELLITNGFRLGPHENIKKIVTGKYKQKQIFEIHEKCAIESSKEHLTVLRSKCKLHFNSPEEKKDEYFQAIMNALEELDTDQTAEISSLLKVLALCPELKIIFDFNRTSTDEIDPRDDKYTEGACYYTTFCITIGAKNLLESGKSSEVLGTMAHEFCHLAMYLMFNNRCEPYEESDRDTKNKFEKIVSDYKKRFDLKRIGENIVKLVYKCYEEDSWHAELIVRVPHMLAHYKGNDKKLKKLRNKFNELFEFYEELIPKTKNKINEMKVKLAVKEINDICGISSELQSSKFDLKDDAVKKFKIDLESNYRQYFKSNCVHLEMKIIYEKAKKLGKFNFLVFTKIQSFKIEKIAKLIFTALKSSNDVAVIVNCDEIDQEESKIIDEVCKKVTKNKKIVFVTNENPRIASIKCQEVNHLLSELTEESQKKLLGIKVNFQGTRLDLNEIWSKNLKSNESVPLDKLSRNEEIKVGEEIKFEEIHVKRKFVAADVKWDRWNKRYDKEPVAVDEIITEIANSKVFVLSDAPGNGKSTEFKFLTFKLKEKFKNRWILLIDLKKHTKNFEKDSENLMNFNSVDKIANFLAEKILKLQTFEKEIFYELFKSDRVVMLMDGVDEISPSYKNFVMKLANGIRKMTGNQLWMATRPHLVKELEEKLKTKAWKLTEFSKEDRVSYIEQIFKKNEKKPKYEEFREIIESFLNDIEEDRYNESEEVTNPLLLYMIAELFIDNPNVQLKKLNLYKIYDEFVEKMFRRLSTRGSEAEKDSVEFMRNTNIQEFHRKIAVEKKFHINLNYSFKNLPKPPTNDQLTRIDLMYSDGNDNFFFIHETFCEFLIAQTIVDKVFELKFQTKEELKEILEVLYEQVLRDYDHVVIRKFLDYALENFAIDQTSDKSKTLINSLDHKRLSFWKEGEYRYNNLIISLSKLVADNQKAVEIWMELVEDDDDIYTNVLGVAFKYQTLEEILKLWSFAEKFFTEDQIKRLFTNKNDDDDEDCDNGNFSAAILNQDERVFDFSLQLADKKLSQSEKEEFINCKSLNWDHIYEDENLKLVLNRIKQHFASQYNDCLRDLTTNVFNFACKHQNHESIKFLCEEITENFGSDELKVILQRKDEEGRNILMIAGENDPAVLETLINFIEDENKVREMLRQENEDGDNVLMYTLQRFSTENNRKVLKAYEKYFSSEVLKEIFTKRNKTKENVLDLAASKSFEKFDLIWAFMKKLFDDETLKSMLMESLENIDRDYLDEFIPLIFQTLTVNEYQMIFPKFLEAAVDMFPDEFKQLLASVDAQNEFADLFYEKLFEFRDKNGKTIIDQPKTNTWVNGEEVLEILEILNKKKNEIFKSNVQNSKQPRIT